MELRSVAFFAEVVLWLDACGKQIFRKIRTGTTRPGKEFESKGLTGEVVSFNGRRRRPRLRRAIARESKGVGEGFMDWEMQGE